MIIGFVSIDYAYSFDTSNGFDIAFFFLAISQTRRCFLQVVVNNSVCMVFFQNYFANSLVRVQIFLVCPRLPAITWWTVWRKQSTRPLRFLRTRRLTVTCKQKNRYGFAFFFLIDNIRLIRYIFPVRFRNNKYKLNPFHFVCSMKCLICFRKIIDVLRNQTEIPRTSFVKSLPTNYHKPICNHQTKNLFMF